MRLDKTSALALREVGKTNVWPRVGNRSESEKRYMKGRGVALGALAVAERMPGATSLQGLRLRADQCCRFRLADCLLVCEVNG